MDAEKLALKKGDPLPKTESVYRLALVTARDRKNKATPSVSAFSLSAADKNKLSVDWERKTTPEESVVRIGCQFRHNTKEFKHFDNREIYALEINFLRSLSEIEDVIYDPVIHLEREKGKVDNPAHSSIVFSENFLKDPALAPEVYLKIRDHAVDKKLAVDMTVVEKLVEKCRNN